MFNENARQREIRERRLTAADNLITYTCVTGDLTTQFLESNDITGLQALTTRAAHNKAYAKLFFPEINEAASNYGAALHDISPPLTSKFLEKHKALCEQYEQPGIDQRGLTKQEYALRLINPNWLIIKQYEAVEISNMVTTILDKVIDIHQDIECKKE